MSAEGRGSLRPSDLRGVGFALAAGLGFGFFFVALVARGRTTPGCGRSSPPEWRRSRWSARWRWSVASRAPSPGPTHAPSPPAPAPSTRAANVLYLLAVRQGMLSVVAVLAALYPVSTILLAHVVLHERFAAIQRVGIAIALPAAILMAM